MSTDVWRISKATKAGKLVWKESFGVFRTELAGVRCSITIDDTAPTLFFAGDHGDTEPLRGVEVNELYQAVREQEFWSGGVREEFRSALENL